MAFIPDFFLLQQSLFTTHELTPVNEGPVSHVVSHPVWLLLVLSIITSLVIIVRIFYRRNISELVRAFLSLSATNQLVRDENILLQRASLILTVVFNLTAAFMVWQFGTALAHKFSLVLNDFNRFLVFAFVIAGIYSLKYVVLKLTGFIFGTDREMDAYIFNIFLSNNLLGMVLFPVMVILFLYPQLSDSKIVFYGVVATAVIFYIYRVLRGILIGRASSSYSPVYLFFYICALEFAPLLVLLKVASPQ
jgi:hypothetical protein